jgi:hypothetical protein
MKKSSIILYVESDDDESSFLWAARSNEELLHHLKDKFIKDSSSYFQFKLSTLEPVFHCKLGDGGVNWIDPVLELLSFICATGGAAKVLSFIQAWVEERKGRFIRIKNEHGEIEIRGGVSEEQISNLIKMFNTQLKPSDQIKSIEETKEPKPKRLKSAKPKS